MECQSPECSNSFVPRPWPATRNKYCSIECNKRAYQLRHRERLNEESKKRYAADPERHREYKRRWNNKPEGYANRLEWQKAHYKETYERAKREKDLLAKVRGRWHSRRILLRSGRPCACEIVGLGEHRGRIECHHLDGNPRNITLSNLQWICKRHHSLQHRKSPPLPHRIKKSRSSNILALFEASTNPRR